MPDPLYNPGQKVTLEIQRRTDLGYVAVVNNLHEGLLYHDEIFQPLHAGQKLDGFVKKVRMDGRLDLQLQPFGNRGAEDLGGKILQALQDNKGYLAINDKTSAEKIHELFGVSKKKYKMALGHLYKNRQIVIEDGGIRLTPKK